MDYSTLASPNTVSKVKNALEARGIKPILIKNRAEALAKIKELIPSGASVMNGASITLEQIGYVDHLKSGEHGWVNLHQQILEEKDPVQQAKLRRESVLADYYLGSVHGLAETGEFVIASNSGSQLPHITYTSPNLIFVVSTKKITSTLEEARKRLREHVVPLEDARMMERFKMHTTLNKELIFHGDAPYLKRNISMLLIDEDLGF